MARKNSEDGPGKVPSDMGSDWHPAVKAGFTQVSLNAQGTKRRRILVQCPLDFYFQQHCRSGKRKGGINDRQHQAGSQLFADFHTSTGTVPSSLQQLGKIRVAFDPKRSIEKNDNQVHAMTQYNQAREFLGGPQDIGWKLALYVACYAYYLKDLPANQYYPKPEHMMGRLREALDKLADFYGIPVYKTRPGPQSGRKRKIKI